MASASPTLARVNRGELCTGCGLCAALAPAAITMDITSTGFARPVQHAPISKASEAKIAQTCPGVAIAPWPRDGSQAPAHPSWGPITQCATGHAVDDAVRFAGSSGGMLSALAIHALESGLVSGILHIAADAEAPLRNSIHLSRTRADVLAGAGSRYGPSPVLDGMESILTATERYLLIGKPCDISAMRALATIDPRVNLRIPYMLSFFCGGMPSLAGTTAIIREMGLEPKSVSRFRYRGNGWPGTARAETKEGAVAEMSYARSWGDFLSSQVQYRCKICPDAVGGNADIACADAWYGGESGYPQFEERDGRSLVVTRTSAGVALLEGALRAGVCATGPLAIDQIDLMQPAQARRKRLVAARRLAAQLLRQPVPRMAGLGVAKSARSAGAVEQLKNLLGSMRRILQGRR